jgi:hypothetical protein
LNKCPLSNINIVSLYKNDNDNDTDCTCLDCIGSVTTDARYPWCCPRSQGKYSSCHWHWSLYSILEYTYKLKCKLDHFITVQYLIECFEMVQLKKEWVNNSKYLEMFGSLGGQCNKNLMAWIMNVRDKQEGLSLANLSSLIWYLLERPGSLHK